MSETSSISATIAERYALALFEIFKDAGELARLEEDADTLGAALDDSPELREMIGSPRVSREEMRAAIDALAGPMGLAETTANTLRLMAEKRRLFVLPQFVAAVREKLAEERGEVAADVVSAMPLSEAQANKVSDLLRVRFGRNIKLSTSVDESLIGGLVVRVGSKMIDTSVRARLASLQSAMKDAG